jgi:hypothetical protein
MDLASPVVAGTPVASSDAAGDYDAPAVDDRAPQVEVPVAQVVAGTADLSAVPLQALTAYQRAAQVIDRADKQCHVDWTLIAAVGQVVSQHGLVDGGHLSGGGVVKPSLVGNVVRSETGDKFADTDAGRLDGDKRHDRAIGPMLLAPTTWSVVGVDADNDGRRNPQDIDDAALAVAVLLCNGNRNLSHDADARHAVARVNGDKAFVSAVLAAAADYAAQEAGSGTTTVVAGPYVTPDLPTTIPARTTVPERTPSDAVTPATFDNNQTFGPGDDDTSDPTDPWTDPTDTDSSSPSDDPTESPTSESPTDDPTDCATDEAGDDPSDGSTDAPSDDPTDAPGDEVCESPSDEPTDPPTSTATPAP